MTRTSAVLGVMTLRGPVTLGRKAPKIIKTEIAITQEMAYLRHLGVRLRGVRSFLRIDRMWLDDFVRALNGMTLTISN
jgi:hypothetical protein